ncbi:MAG: DUF4058 family protein [Isosphaeraceae bacterium]|nr:DUF4058 family protein [Isosphaeraceae bacterium]
MQASLNGMLKPKYHVRIAERVYISDENDLGRMVIIPDLRIAVRPGQEGTAFVPGGGTTLEVAEPIIATTMIEDEIHEARLEVIDRARRLVVTVIEVLSPTNKIAGARGQASFEWKRREVMNSPSHWVEIDLLRAGLPLFGEGLLPPHEYVVHISRVDRRPKGLLWSRADRRPKGLLWPIRLSQRLPVLPIPLKPEDPDAPLDLQAVLATAYDRAAYDLEIDYRAEPVPPLEGEWAAWADRLLREKGLR